ncbi:MAG: zinc ribbon domain-containing protein [Planctomycetes bacterium]|nr:zinc ribbon domain-containing protein [Planctomycetota bacterium]
MTAPTYENPYLAPDVIEQLELIYPPGTIDHRRFMLGEIGVPREGAVATPKLLPVNGGDGGTDRMSTMRGLAGRFFRSWPELRCDTCHTENAPGIVFCEACGTVLGDSKCPRCGVVNPKDVVVCGFCRCAIARTQSALPVPLDIRESLPPVPAAPHEEPPPAALIGFGAVLSLAAAAYPWYLFGGFEASPEQRATIAQLLEAGWRGFPGVPLTLIAIAAVTSTMVSVLKELEAVRPAVAVASGVVTLLSALWLSQGFERMQTSGPGQAMPLTGSILVTIGAIVVLTAGLYLWNHQRTRAPSQSPAPRTIIPLEAAPASAPVE